MKEKKVVILLMASAGLRIGAVHLLKIGDLEKVGDLYRITVYQGSKEEYITLQSGMCQCDR